MTEKQHEILSVIKERTQWADDDTSKPLTRFFVPNKDGNNWSDALHRHVHISGSGAASCLKGMARREWIKAQPVHPYAYSITEEGIVALEAHREATGFYKG